MAQVNIELCAQAIRNKFAPAHHVLALDPEEDLEHPSIRLALLFSDTDHYFSLMPKLRPSSIPEKIELIPPRLSLAAF